MSHYKAHYSVLKKSSKYSLYMSHFENIPYEDISYECKKETEDLVTINMFADDIDSLNSGLEWIENTIGIEPYKIEWIEKSK